MEGKLTQAEVLSLSPYELWSNLAQVVYKRTYARKDNKKLEDWADTVNRAIAGNIRGHNVEEKEVERLQYFMLNRKGMSAGRGLWFSGAPSHEKLGGVALNNPLHEDTKILTKEHGWIALKEIEGEDVTVLSCTKLYGREKKGEEVAPNSKWVPASISYAEHHPCKKLTYKDKEGHEYSVVSSLNHRWFRKKTTKHEWERVSCEELREGDYLPRIKPPKYFKMSFEGAKHGLFFGDGTRQNGALFQFKDEDKSLLRFLFGEQVKEEKDAAAVRHLPLAWGETPKGSYKKDKKYVYGFLAGYFAADGHIHKKSGSMSVSSARLDELEEIKEMFWELGVGTGEIYLESNSSNYSEERELYRLSINKNDLNEDFFLKPCDLEIWKKTKSKKSETLRLVSIENVEGEQRVLCATVPEYEQFVTEGFCLTSNCWFLTGDDWMNLVIATDLLMLGGGVGMSVEHEFVNKLPKVKKGIKIEHSKTNDADFIVSDKREGWCKLIEKVLEAFFVTGKSFDYSTILVRGKEEPIKGFGGKASGPLPLIDCVKKLSDILNARAGRHVRPIDMMDLLCCIGEMVVAGNVRRSAIIILGDAWDKNYLRAKRWDLGPIPTFRAMANLSVVVDDIEDLHPGFWKTYEHGEPFGIVNRTNMQNFGRMSDPRLKIPDPCVGVNPCVPAGTEILTRSGYRAIDSLVGEKVEVWNGFEWSEVEPKITGYDQPMVKVTLSSGQSLVCTEAHKFVIALDYKGNNERLPAVQLKEGMKLMKAEYPVIEEGRSVPEKEAYTQGFISGDGTDDYKYLHLYGKKQELAEFMSGKVTAVQEKQDRSRFYPFFEVIDQMPKSFVPFSWDKNSRLSWFAGLLDADGCELKEGGAQVSSVDKEFLLNTQKMLTTLGIASKVTAMHKAAVKNMPGGQYQCKESFRLLIGAQQMQSLKSIGLNTHRLAFDKAPQRDASQFVRVLDVERIGTEDVVYCFTENKRNLGCFEGIVTGQCAEATLENGEPCNLLEIPLPNLKDADEFEEVARLLFRYGKRVTCEHYHHDLSDAVIKKNRRIGVGITGCLQSPLFTPEILDRVYKAIQDEDKKYSKELGVPRSIKTTVIKPSGTLSLLCDCTAGIHPAYSRFYIRRVRFSSNDPLVPILKEAGHHVEPVERFDGTLDHATVVADFYVKAPEGTPVADENWDTWKQLEMVKTAQRHWADQSVSVTVYYKKEELPQLKEWLAKNLSELKTISFLCHSDHGFKQAPLEKITEEQYEKLTKKIKPLNLMRLDEGHEISSLECDGGVCPVK